MSAPQTRVTGHAQGCRDKPSLYHLLPFLLSQLSCHHPYPQFLLTYNHCFLQSSAKSGVSGPLLRSALCLPASFVCLSVSSRGSQGTSSLPASPAWIPAPESGLSLLSCVFPLEQSFPSRPRHRLLVNPGEGEQRGRLCVRTSAAGITEYVNLLRAGAVYSPNGAVGKEFPGGSCVKSSSGAGFGTARELEASWCGRDIVHSPAMRLERRAGLASWGQDGGGAARGTGLMALLVHGHALAGRVSKTRR